MTTAVNFEFFNRVAPNKGSRIFAVWNRSASAIDYRLGTWDDDFFRYQDDNGFDTAANKETLDTCDAAWCLESALAGACTFFPF